MDTLLLQFEILWPAFLAGLLVLVTHIPLGQEVLKRGIIFLDLAIAQIAAFALVFVNYLGVHADHGYLSDIIAVSAAVIGALMLYRLSKFDAVIQEALIGVMFILAASGSILVLASDPHGGEHLKEILVGQILWVQPTELISTAITYALVLFAWFGLRQRMGDWMFYVLFAITITFATQLVGVYLVFASLIIPALATYKNSKPLRTGYVIALLGYLFGLVLSAMLDLPSGAMIVWSLAIVAVLYYLIFKKERDSFQNI